MESNKFYDVILRIWKDPVWSKIIAAGITGIILSFPIKKNYQIIVDFFHTEITIVVWCLFPLIIFVSAMTYIVSSLVNKQHDKADNLYSVIVNKISVFLLLDNWSPFIDHAIRGLVYDRFINNQRDFNELVLTTLWPRKNRKIETKIHNVNNEYNKFITIFTQHCKLEGNIYREIKYYKVGGFNKNYDKDLVDYKKWSSDWYLCLHNLIVELNELIVLCNKYLPIDSLSETLHKKYLIEDSQGIYNQMNPTLMQPTKKVKLKSK